MAFLGGLLSTLGPMLPGIIGTVGDIVKRVANRPEGQSFGSALLGAAPAALSGISGVAKQLAPALGGTAGGVLSKIGQGADLAGEFVGKPSFHTYKGYAPGSTQVGPDGQDFTMLSGGPFRMAPEGTFSGWQDRAYPGVHVTDMSGGDHPDSQEDPIGYIKSIAKDLESSYGPPEVPLPVDLTSMADSLWREEEHPADAQMPRPITNATDMLPVRHGAINGVPPMIAGHQQNQSGPFASHTMPPAELYNEDRSDASPGAQPRVSQSMHPAAQVNYRGAPTMVDRTQQQSFGNTPSFNVFDKLAAAPPQREQAIAQPEIPAAIMAGYNKWIKRKDKKKARRNR